MPAPHIALLAAIDTGEVVGVIIAVLYGLYWLLRKLGESQQQPPPATKEPERQTFTADEEQVQQFLESLGATPAQTSPQPARPQPARPPRAPAPSRPPAPPPRPEPAEMTVALTPMPPLEPQREYAHARPVPKPPKLPPRFVAEPKRAPKPPTLPSEPRAVTAPAQRLAFPRLAPLKRAVVLAEILPRRRGPHRFARH
jgi:hypothetical protein